MSTVELQATSVEYLRFPFTADVDPASVTGVEVAFVLGRYAPLGAAPEWVAADVVTGTASHARLLVGQDVELPVGVYTWYVRVTDSPEVAVERGDNLIRVIN